MNIEDVSNNTTMDNELALGLFDRNDLLHCDECHELFVWLELVKVPGLGEHICPKCEKEFKEYLQEIRNER
jgi:hypothetical protein